MILIQHFVPLVALILAVVDVNGDRGKVELDGRVMAKDSGVDPTFWSDAEPVFREKSDDWNRSFYVLLLLVLSSLVPISIPINTGNPLRIM